ncbi:hypothetical protein EVS84_08765 [Pseudomonas koreensis]|uniref:Uncharacterized protein n=1 Tax=Pseudomonas koreensis TaxID=198620 RepID=A0A4Q4L5J5_9PSED|nr:hypothetical protein EVS84_08765 [Pseudomonas koreensis]
MGASLLANASGQSTLMLADLPLSRAGSLPQDLHCVCWVSVGVWQCRYAKNVCGKRSRHNGRITPRSRARSRSMSA